MDNENVEKEISQDLGSKEQKFSEEKWETAYCTGNGYVRGCGKPYQRLNWHTPSGCPHCHATFVD